jgi:RNA polymerase sigma factor (sigma-70 family)
MSRASCGGTASPVRDVQKCNSVSDSASILRPALPEAKNGRIQARYQDAERDEDRTMASMRMAIADGIKAKTSRRAVRAKNAPDAAAQEDLEEARSLQFSELYNDYFPKVFAYVYGRVQDKEVSLDIVSDVFEKAFMKMRSLRSPDSFGSWLFTIARNEVSSHWRKEKPASKAAQEAARENEMHNQQRGPEETVLHKERLAALSSLVRQLPRREQEIIALKFDAELTNREIAGILGTTEVNVRVTIFRALRKLRDRMQALGGHSG